MTEFERQTKSLWTSMRSAEDDAEDIKRGLKALLFGIPLSLSTEEKRGLALAQTKWEELKPVLDRINDLWESLNAVLKQKETL